MNGRTPVAPRFGVLFRSPLSISTVPLILFAPKREKNLKQKVYERIPLPDALKCPRTRDKGIFPAL